MLCHMCYVIKSVLVMTVTYLMIAFSYYHCVSRHVDPLHQVATGDVVSASSLVQCVSTRCIRLIAIVWIYQVHVLLCVLGAITQKDHSSEKAGYTQTSVL